MKTKTMQQTICGFALFLFVLAAAVPASFAQEEEYDGFKVGIEHIPGIDDALSSFSEASPIDFGTGFTLTSAYMWRGQKLGGDTSFQPWVSVSPDFEPFGNFTFTIWANVTKGLEPDRNSEVDYTLDYNFNISELSDDPESFPVDVNLNFGYIYYRFPGSDTRTQEIYGGFTMDTLLHPSFKVYHDWNGGSGEWYEFGIAQDIDLKALTVSTYAKLGYNHEQWAVKNTDTFSTLDFGASIPIPVGEHMTIAPFLNYTKRLNSTYTVARADLTEDELYGGFNYSISF